MIDELELLRQTPVLRKLLGHYAQLAGHDRTAWQDRLMQLDELPPREMTRLHGELIAFNWLEQNTAGCPGLRQGVVPCCYRVTTAGLRALKQADED